MRVFDPLNPTATPKLPEDYGFCRLCYKPLPPGGMRAIGICAACAFRPEASAPIPNPHYNFGGGRHGAR